MPTVDLDRVGAEPRLRGPASPLVRRHPIVAADDVACWEVGKLVEGADLVLSRPGLRPKLRPGQLASSGVQSWYIAAVAASRSVHRLSVPSGSSWRSAGTSGIVSPPNECPTRITSSSSSPAPPRQARRTRCRSSLAGQRAARRRGLGDPRPPDTASAARSTTFRARNRGSGRRWSLRWGDVSRRGSAPPRYAGLG